jgi:peptide deformylase
MAIREILLYPQQKAELRKKSSPVPGIDQQVKQLIYDLEDTLAAHPDGVGLAAPQINAHHRVLVVRLPGEEREVALPTQTEALVNPVIVIASNKQRDYDGCLSFPGLYGETIRPHFLRVTGLDEHGQPFDRVFEGFDAVIVHHEIDHLNGVLFIDRIERLEDLYRVKQDRDGHLLRVPIQIYGSGKVI